MSARHAARWPWVAAVMLAGCGQSEATLPVEPCTLRLEHRTDLDLDLQGSGTCEGSAQLALRVATGSPTSPTFFAVGAAPVRVEGEWRREGSAVRRTVRLINPGSTSVSVVGLEWSTPAPDGLGVAADRLLNNGYQSWSYSGVLPIPRALDDLQGTAPHGGDNEDFTGERRGVSWWWTWVGDATGRGLVAGADGATVFKTYFAVDGRGHPRLRVVQGLTGDALELGPGQSVELDGLWLSFGDAQPKLDEYAAAVAARHPRPAPARPALGGWGSWNVYYAGPSASSMREEAAWATANLLPLGLDSFLLDDGYEPHWGQWTDSVDFGADLGELNAEHRRAGLRPAVWLAPVYVDLVDPLVTQHPDWFVHRADGALRTFTNFGPTSAVLDVSHPEARAHVTRSLRRLWDQGFDTFKLDFLFGAAVEGTRQQPLTGLQSYARWLEVIRQALPDAHLVGCGAPLLASVGAFDSMRTGADIAFSVSPEPAWAFIASQARQTITRAVTDRWWSIDPDVVLLRGQRLDDAEAWTAVVAAALSGGNYLLGDARQASAARRAMALWPRLLELTRDGQSARPLDFAAQLEADVVVSPLLTLLVPTDAGLPHLWQKVSADGQRTALAVFAWDRPDYRATITLPPGALELSPSDGSHPLAAQPAPSGPRTISVPRHGVRLFTW